MRRRFPKLEDRRALGRSGLRVSPICLGATLDEDTIGAAFDAGINFFFLSADLHWPVYEAARRGLRRLLGRPGVRDQVVIAVTAYVGAGIFHGLAFQEVLAAVPELERIDLAIVGGLYANDATSRIATARRHRAERAFGARACGASFHDRPSAIEPINKRQIDAAFIRYNPSHPGAERDLFPSLTRPTRPLIYAFKTAFGCWDGDALTELGLRPNDWRPSPTDYYRFALRLPAIDGLLVSLSGEREVRELSDALARGPLTSDEAQYLQDLTALQLGTASLAT